MMLESQGMFNKALVLYESILEKDQCREDIWKRKVAIFKAQGDTQEAIKELNEYLKVFICDYEAWLELSELYISTQCYEEAAYCLEEVLLANPHNYLHHQRYAEICYTAGGAEWYALACKHYARSIKLNPRNIRALYGYHLALCAGVSSSKGSNKLYKEKKESIDWVASQIKKIYAECCSKERLRLVEETLESLEKTAQQGQ
jgi:tetratricopeptide (TPR) repeat protein